MQSLRTRRASTKPASKSQTRQLKKSQPGVRDVRKSRVDDKIKKRMSMRYADISAPTGLDIPSVPSLPSALRIGGESEQDEVVRDRNSIVEDPRANDKRILEREDFDADACKWDFCHNRS
jgi:exocyst complex component 8